MDSQSGVSSCIVSLTSENRKKIAGVFDTEVSTAGVPISALIASMCRSAQRVTLADRTALYAQGEPANTLFLILDGFVKTSRICEEGTEITIELLKYGDIAGAIPTRQPPSEHEETAWAIGDVVVQRVLAHELRAAMDVNPRLAVFVAEYLARSKRSAERRVLRAMSQSVDRRVIETWWNSLAALARGARIDSRWR